jgi:hypothetical protein
MTITHLTRRPRRYSCRGAASVEAVVVLPVFVIIFVSVFYIRGQVLSRQAAESKARTCAWAYSVKNCNEIPPGCESVLQVVSGAGQVDDKIEEKLAKAKAGIVAPVIAKILEPALKAAFGRALDARTQQFYERPALYGGGTATSSGSYHLACNLTPETPLDVAKDAWNALSKF